MAYKGQEFFEPAPTASIIHAYNSDGVSIPVLTDEEIWKVIRASGANLIGKPNMQPRVQVLDRYIEERGMWISQVEQSLAIEESHASYFWEKQVIGRSSYEMSCMEVNTCGDSLSPRVVSTFLDCCDYPELISFIYFAPTPLLKGYKIETRESLISQCFTHPSDCFGRYIIECHIPVDIPTGKLFIVRLYRRDISEMVETLRRDIYKRYSNHPLRLKKGGKQVQLMVNSQQEEYLSCAFYNCDEDFINAILNPQVREEEALYLLEDCFDDVMLSTDTPFVFDHDFDPPGYTGVWVTGGTGYIALHVTPHRVGETSNFVELCTYIHPSMWVFERDSLVLAMWPILKLFQPERAEIHYLVASKNIVGVKNIQRKFIKKRLVGLGYTSKDITAFHDEFFGRTFFHLNIEKKQKRLKGIILQRRQIGEK